MSTNAKLYPLNQNPYQNAGQATVDGFSNNLRYCDVGQMTAEEFNTKIGSSAEMAHRMSVTHDAEEDEPLFGMHIREAAATVRKLFGR